MVTNGSGLVFLPPQSLCNVAGVNFTSNVGDEHLLWRIIILCGLHFVHEKKKT
jgi:hypothetical protein